jgi:uncharacterized protein YcfJ|tara:strand:- start:54 stop:485 length:432 start_codon:yes stop_codon:yes gene_type:complete
MKHNTLIVAGIVALFATSANAETVQDHYKTVIEQNPYRVEVCKNVQIQGQASTGDTIFGALIGGAIGNQFGGGKGKDAATILGAIVGADVANKNGKKPSSTQRQCQTETRYEETQREMYSHSTVTFVSDGRQYTVKFQKRQKN